MTQVFPARTSSSRTARPSFRAVTAFGLVLLLSCSDDPLGHRFGVRPAAVRIDAPGLLVVAGDSMRLGFTLLDGAGHEIVPPPTGAGPQWATRDHALLAIRSDGMAHGVHPGYATVTLEVLGLTDSLTFRVDADTITMHVVGAYLVQTVQRMDGGVPLVAGHDALLRVFVEGDKIGAALSPPVHVQLFEHEVLLDTLILPAASSTVPYAVREEQLGTSWNYRVPGDLVRPGLGFRVVLDPAGTVPRRDASRTRYPEDGGILPVDVRALAAHRVRFIPIHLSELGVTGDVHDGNYESFLDLFQRVFPVPEVDAAVRTPFYTSTPPVGTSAWATILGEIHALWQAEGATEYYYGVMPVGGSGGMAFVGGRVAIGTHNQTAHPFAGTVAAATFAHEVGHNFGRRHAPCGGAGGVDPDYPYANAQIGVVGYDLARRELRRPNVHDVMSYCVEWISDYNYERALAFRHQHHSEAVADGAPRATEPVLLVWGRIGPDGQLHLEPAFQLTGRPRLPAAEGPYLIEGTDEAGSVLFSIRFTGDEVDHAPGVRLFAFTIPIGHLAEGRLHRLRLTGPAGGIERVRTRAGHEHATHAVPDAGDEPLIAARPAPGGRLRITWPVADYPMALVRDARTGHIVAFARGGDIELATAARPLEVLLSYGTGSTRVGEY